MRKEKITHWPTVKNLEGKDSPFGLFPNRNLLRNESASKDQILTYIYAFCVDNFALTKQVKGRLSFQISKHASFLSSPTLFVGEISTLHTPKQKGYKIRTVSPVGKKTYMRSKRHRE